jgi:anti-anti-sigma regulatory factor
MKWDFVSGDDCLIIKLSGNTSPNERLLAKRGLMRHLRTPNPRVTVDLSEIKDHGGAYGLGVPNTIRKEVAILGGQMKLCALPPNLYRVLRNNRFAEFFEINSTLSHAEKSFRKECHEDRYGRDTEGNLFTLGTEKGSHSYLVRGGHRNVLIDSGLDERFLNLQELLASPGSSPVYHLNRAHQGKTRCFRTPKCRQPPLQGDRFFAPWVFPL